MGANLSGRVAVSTAKVGAIIAEERRTAKHTTGSVYNAILREGLL